MTNNIKMFGPDISLNFDDKFVLNFQYVWRTDSQVFPVMVECLQENVMTDGGFAEIIFSPKGDMSKWYLTGLVNYIEF